MAKKDPLAPENALTKWNEISSDELQARMNRKFEYEGPIREIVYVLEEALAGVLMFLGVDVSQPKWVQEYQQEQLGITLYLNEEETTPQLNGYYVHTDYDEYAPFAWIGMPFVEDGKAWVNVEMFREGKKMKVGGVKLKRKNQ
jgi:hypothetical protein